MWNSLTLQLMRAKGDTYHELTATDIGSGLFGGDIGMNTSLFLLAPTPSRNVEALLIRLKTDQPGKFSTPSQMLASSAGDLDGSSR